MEYFFWIFVAGLVIRFFGGGRARRSPSYLFDDDDRGTLRDPHRPYLDQEWGTGLDVFDGKTNR